MTAPHRSGWHLALVVLAVGAGASLAAAEQYPSRAIRVVVPFAPGGAPDIVARIIAGALEKPLGQSLIVENRTGANGIVGMQAVATADPDGYTLLNVPPAFVVNPSVYKTLPFDIFRDFAPVANIGISDGYLVMVRPGLPVNTIGELIDYAKTHRVLYGSAGIGNTLHLAAALFCAKAGIEMEHVTFRGAALPRQAPGREYAPQAGRSGQSTHGPQAPGANANDSRRAGLPFPRRRSRQISEAAL